MDSEQVARCGPGTVLEDGVCVVARAEPVDAGVAKDAGSGARSGCSDVDPAGEVQLLDDALFPRVLSLSSGRALVVDEARGVRARLVDASGALAGPPQAIVDLGPTANVLSRTETALADDHAVVAWTERSGANEVAVLEASGRPVARAPLPSDLGSVLGSAPTAKGFRLLALRNVKDGTEAVIVDGDDAAKLGVPRTLSLGEGATVDSPAVLLRTGEVTLAILVVVPPGGAGRVVTGFRIDAAGVVSPPIEIGRASVVAPLSAVAAGNDAWVAWGDGSLQAGGTFKKELTLRLSLVSVRGAETAVRAVSSRPLLVVGNRASEATLAAATGQSWLVERGSQLVAVPFDATGPRSGVSLALRPEAYLTDVSAGATRDALLVAWTERPAGARGRVQLAAYRCLR